MLISQFEFEDELYDAGTIDHLTKTGQKGGPDYAMATSSKSIARLSQKQFSGEEPTYQRASKSICATTQHHQSSVLRALNLSAGAKEQSAYESQLNMIKQDVDSDEEEEKSVIRGIYLQPHPAYPPPPSTPTRGGHQAHTLPRIMHWRTQASPYTRRGACNRARRYSRAVCARVRCVGVGLTAAVTLGLTPGAPPDKTPLPVRV